MSGQPKIASETPAIITPAEHGVARGDLSAGALAVLDGLHAAGYRACLVGGAVRDLLLGIAPKDFDVATDAEPEQVAAVFGRQARLIGRRFRIVHVRVSREIIEVSTFRADPATSSRDPRRMDASGRVLADNVFGSIAEDARRRDFAINGLYYDIADGGVYDYVGGAADAQARILRLIGDAETRYREDPVRMLRVIRLAASHELTIDPAAEPPADLVGLIAEVPPARLFDEVLKLLMQAASPAVYARLRAAGLFSVLFPDTAAALAGPGGAASSALIERAIANTATRIEAGQSVTPAFILVAILWPAVREAAAAIEAGGTPPIAALASAQARVMTRQTARVTIPKRFAGPMREIWQLQPRFHKRRGKQPGRLLAHPRFRAAYDFLLLRAAVGEIEPELADWWTERQAQEPASDGAASSNHASRRGGRRRRGRRRRAE